MVVGSGKVNVVDRPRLFHRGDDPHDRTSREASDSKGCCWIYGSPQSSYCQDYITDLTSWLWPTQLEIHGFLSRVRLRAEDALPATPTWRGPRPEKWANKSKPLIFPPETLQKSQYSTNRMIAWLMENLTIKYEMRWITMAHSISVCSWIRTRGAIVTPLRPSYTRTSLGTTDVSSKWWRGAFADSTSSQTWLQFIGSLHRQIQSHESLWLWMLWFDFQIFTSLQERNKYWKTIYLKD